MGAPRRKEQTHEQLDVELRPEVRLPWQAHPWRELLRLAWPIGVSMIGYSTMTVVGTAFVGRLGPAALAGVGLGGVAAFTLAVFTIGLLRGVKVMISQAVGAQRPQEARAYLAAGVAIAAVLGVVTALAGQLCALVLPMLASSAEAGELAALYLRIRCLGAPLWMVYAALREGRYGVGDARSPMVATLIANLANIALDYVFILELGLGVGGAAWATVIAHGVELLVLGIFYGRSADARFRWRHVVALWNVGFPTALQFLMEVGSFAVLSAIISSMSEVDMAAHLIALHSIHFSFLPALAVGEAASVLTGQAVGAGEEHLVRRVSLLGLWMAVAYNAMCTIVIVVGAPTIAGLFTEDIHVLTAATSLLHVAAVFQIADGASIIARSSLRGVGDVRFAAVVGICLAWVITPPTCWVLGHLLGYGALGGWLGLCGEITLGAAVFWRRLLSTRWRAAAARTREQVVGA
jgi:MATE family multidrug resistance protein